MEVVLSNYPAPDAAHLVERIEVFPPRVRPRRWVLRDDNAQHYHGVVRLGPRALYLELHWKAASDSDEQLVGRYRLHLPELLAADYVRFERENEKGSEVRLRVYRGAGGVIFIQTRNDRPGLPIGQVRL